MRRSFICENIVRITDESSHDAADSWGYAEQVRDGRRVKELVLEQKYLDKVVEDVICRVVYTQEPFFG